MLNESRLRNNLQRNNKMTAATCLYLLWDISKILLLPLYRQIFCGSSYIPGLITHRFLEAAKINSFSKDNNNLPTVAILATNILYLVGKFRKKMKSADSKQKLNTSFGKNTCYFLQEIFSSPLPTSIAPIFLEDRVWSWNENVLCISWYSAWWGAVCWEVRNFLNV